MLLRQRPDLRWVGGGITRSSLVILVDYGEVGAKKRELAKTPRISAVLADVSSCATHIAFFTPAFVA
jgi:hypothetical protein